MQFKRVHDTIIAQMFYSTRGLRKTHEILRFLIKEAMSIERWLINQKNSNGFWKQNCTIEAHKDHQR